MATFRHCPLAPELPLGAVCRPSLPSIREHCHHSPPLTAAKCQKRKFPTDRFQGSESTRRLFSAAWTASHCRSKNTRVTPAFGAMASNPWNAPGTTSNAHSTPAAVNLRAYSRFSSWSGSSLPTPIHAAGSRERSRRLAGTACSGSAPRKYASQPRRLVCSVHSRCSGLAMPGRCDVRSSSIG